LPSRQFALIRLALRELTAACTNDEIWVPPESEPFYTGVLSDFA
jgi:hypothetical protein